MTNFGGNCNFGVVLWFGLFWMFLLYGWALYLCDHGRFYSSATVHGFLESWRFIGFLRGWLFFLGETTFFVWFYAFDCFWVFRVMDGNFLDFVILMDYKALPWCLGFQSLGGLGVSEDVDWFCEKSQFWCVFMLSIVLFCLFVCFFFG